MSEMCRDDAARGGKLGRNYAVVSLYQRLVTHVINFYPNK